MFRTRFVTAALLCAALSGCFGSAPSDIHVDVTPLAQYRDPAKPPDCILDVLFAEPSQSYTKLAIVEGWAGEDQQDELMRALKSSACEIGADALLVVSQRGQNVPLHLYRATPNEESEETTSGKNLEPGHYLHKEEHVPKVGEAGHSGFYIDAAAIAYNRGAKDH